MAETQTSTTREGDVLRRVETTVVSPNRTATKAFKLKDGAKHMQDGQYVRPGDVVHLSQSQAMAFRDKFEPVDSSSFRIEREAPVYRRDGGDEHLDDKQKQAEENIRGLNEAQKGEGVTTAYSTGLPVPQPPIVVPNRPPAVTAPLDVHATDPERSGQLSREQRQIIDSGGAPMPTSVQEKTEGGERTSQVAVGTGGGHVVSGGTVAPGDANVAKPATGSEKK